MGRSERGVRARRALLAGCCAAWLTAGCATVGPSPGGQPSPALAPRAGSAVGWSSGDRAKAIRRRAAIEAGVGPLAAGAISYYMDVQEAKLRELLHGTGVSVTRIGDEITLSLPEALTFAADSAELMPSIAGALDSVGVVLKKYDKTVIEVAGHTDSTGPHEHGQRLTERRAATVGAFLEKCGIIKARLVTIGAAETRPVATNGTLEGRASNRRVELTLSPLTQGS
ncbi:MAG TPA: OmpA family protein [Steroidobacteraceae bacterium]|nr:OmpA family protein [Steroidobacteraceae bacterium]